MPERVMPAVCVAECGISQLHLRLTMETVDGRCMRPPIGHANWTHQLGCQLGYR